MEMGCVAMRAAGMTGDFVSFGFGRRVLSSRLILEEIIHVDNGGRLVRCVFVGLIEDWKVEEGAQSGRKAVVDRLKWSCRMSHCQGTYPMQALG